MQPRPLVISEFFPHAKHLHEGYFAWEQLRYLPGGRDAPIIAPAVRYPPLPRYRALRRRTAIPGKEQRQQATIYRIALPYVPKISEWYLPGLFYRKIRRLVVEQRLRFNVIHALWAYRSGYAAWRLAQASGVPCAISVLGSDAHTWLHEPAKREYILAALRQAQAVIVPNTEFQHLLAANGVPATRLHLIPQGIDPRRFRPAVSPKQAAVRERFGVRFIFISIGNLYPVKGFDILLRALTEINAGLILIGDGPERDSLLDLAAILGVSDRVWFVGQQPPETIVDWLNAADALIVASHREGAPVVLLEALACGKPVIATDTGLAPLALRGHQTGIIVAPGNTDALTEAMAEATKRQWNAGLIRMRTLEFTWQAYGKRLATVYESLLARDVRQERSESRLQ